MKFYYYDLLPDKNKAISVDGAFDAKLQLSHWIGNSSPKELKADTTTEMSFKLIENSNKEKYLTGIEYISNNHFDADGLLSAFVLLDPDYALQHKNEIINMAITGDFSEFTTEDALKSIIVIESLLDEEKSFIKEKIKNINYSDSIQCAYEEGFKLVSKLIDDIDQFEKYWIDEFSFFVESEKSFERQESIVSNYDNLCLSIVEIPKPLSKVSIYKNIKNDIVLTAIKSNNGNIYDLEYKMWTWFDTIREKKIKRNSFETFANLFNQIEKNKSGIWKTIGGNPIYNYDYHLNFVDKNNNLIPSSLKIYELENILFNNLESFLNK
ncbi:MAG: hypothetical protein STSR0008_16390 [Ignavibacterium sp.]